MLLATYIRGKREVKTLIKLGFEKIIIEEPHFSLLSKRYYDSSPNYKYIEAIHQNIKTIKPDTITVFNLDIIPHNKNLKKIKTLTKRLKNINCNYIRLQDITIAPYILDIYPDVNIELNSITGNYNHKAIIWLEKNFGKSLSSIVLSKEITNTEIKKINKASKINKEILVQGPVQLLYSKRKLIENHPELDKHIQKLKEQNKYSVYLQEKKRPEQYFKLINNYHGSMLFLPQTLCLIKEIKTIRDIGISSMLCDFRDNMTMENIIAITNMYKTEINTLITREKTNGKVYYEEIEEYYTQGLTEGFFKENNTGIKKNIYENNEKDKIATVKSIVKGKLIAIEVIKPFSINDKLKITTPENKQLNYSIQKMTDPKGKNIKNAKKGRILLLNWRKGIIPKSTVYKDLV